MAKEGARDDLVYGGHAELDEIQEVTADYLLGGEEFSILEKGAEGRAPAERAPAIVLQPEQSAKEKAASDRAEKNAAMMSKLLTDKISATLDGNTAEANRLEGMIEVLKERMK